ncbi:formate hydrogenlyase subunit 3 [Citrobacter koseri]|uniref:formate hydrogenlyase subunit 3 n=2 Tax=Citrobacter koseri TaxID=545 RepID=UPI000E130AD1|nr:formate hydrogenlyase subunit 3 [Citrobacter koseri]MBJ9302546.1 formate hydrogenlyase subunit 3 [Citrobacter koseri]MBJ9367052.1 formate hydrogenlyase subunit 3 [Citrobacter koseri]QYG83578.1 formate hydrogenlyase subunit 3 [Citrobacter koseri]SUX90156.1 formate hydrogenlyase subunit 3 [Citrobacter koseri]HAT2781680.1 formate hydrogenlyase subunit 3 [Citrobacter koseri]
MNAISLINSGVAWFAAAAVLAFLFSFHKALSGWVAGVGGAVGSLYTAAAGFSVLVNATAVSGVMPLIGHGLQITPLNAIWLITLGLCGLFVSLYNIDWHRHPLVLANGLLVNLLMAAAVCAVVASNLGTLVVMAEIMALCAVFLTGCSKEGKLWFALGRIGTLLLAVACWLVWQRYGTLELRLLDLRAQALPLGSDIWLLGVVGFGLLAGIIPLHGWVPQAHANASAPAAALFSTVVMKMGLLGILSLSLIGGNAPLWWGVLLLVLGMITAFVGGLYALMEHNIQRLLAYHTLENIGIILLGLGAGVTGIALNQPALIALGLTGGLYHLVNHSLFKSVLFLGAGSIWFRTGHRDIEKLGGIGKRMPVISVAMLIGLMAMAALPPLNGFAGEWVIYQSFFKLGNSGAFIGRLLGPLLAVGLAITGALAVMCMAKVYGVTFLGAPRTKEAENACCAPILMGVSVVALAICCVLGGVAAPWLLPLISAAVPLPLETANTTVSQPMITLLLIACPLLPFIIMAIFKGNRLPSRSRGAAWVCGYDHEQSMVITAHGFAMPVKEAFAPVLKLRKWLNPVSLVPGWQNAAAPVLFRRLALIELAVLVVIVVSRGA